MEFVQENNVLNVVNVQEIIKILDEQENKIDLVNEDNNIVLFEDKLTNTEKIDFPSGNYDETVGEDKQEELLFDSDSDEDLDDVEKIVLKDVIIILNPDDVVIKKKRYSDAHRRAQQKYRKSHPEKTKEQTKKTYETLKQNKEWVEEHNRRNREYQKKKYDERKAELLASGIELKPRGRPRKIVENKMDTENTENKENHIDV